MPARATDYRSIGALLERVNTGADSPTLTDHALRQYLTHAETNGLDKHICRLGKKWMISESGFFEWMETSPSNPPRVRSKK